MFDSQQSIDTFLNKYQADLDRLKRLLRIMHSISDIRYMYHYLRSLEPKATHEFIMHVEAITTGLVVGYGRIFTSTEGVTKLNENSVPKHLRAIHDEIMRLRHERYAHHGAHDSIQADLDVEFDGTSFTLKPSLNFKVCLGAPKEWAPLFEWLDHLMFETLKKQLDHITKISGIEWKIPSGPAPYWIPGSEREN